MKKSMMFVAVAFVAMMAFVGCANPVVPQKTTISDTFVQIDATGTVLSGIYQWDGAGDYYAADGTALTVQAKGADIFTVSKGGVNYFNQKFVNTSLPANETNCLYFTLGGGGGDWCFFVDSGEVGVATFNTTWVGAQTLGVYRTYEIAGYLANGTYTVTGTAN